MRRDLNKPLIGWTVRIPPEDLDALKVLFPARGMKKWAVEKALSSFVELMKGSKELQTWAHDQVQDMLYGPNQVSGRIAYQEITAQIPTELYLDFNKMFPEWGATTWVMRRIIKQLVKDMQEDGPTFEERIESSVNRAMRPEEMEPEPVETIHQGPDQ